MSLNQNEKEVFQVDGRKEAEDPGNQPSDRSTKKNPLLDNECLQCRDPNCGLYGCMKQ